VEHRRLFEPGGRGYLPRRRGAEAVRLKERGSGVEDVLAGLYASSGRPLARPAEPGLDDRSFCLD
jgi:hypothetical protein